MKVRQNEKHLVPRTKIMHLREYGQYAKKVYGPQSINDFMLRVMSMASGGAALTRDEWDKMVVGIKLKHAALTYQGKV